MKNPERNEHLTLRMNTPPNFRNVELTQLLKYFKKSMQCLNLLFSMGVEIYVLMIIANFKDEIGYCFERILKETEYEI